MRLLEFAMRMKKFEPETLQKMAGNVKLATGKKPFVLPFAERGSLVMVSAENGDGAADYYGEFRGGGYPYIDPALEAFATKYDAYWEWVNPGQIAMYPA